MPDYIQNLQRDDAEAFDIASFCQRFRINRTAFYRELDAGRLAAKKVGRRTIIARADALRWLENLPKQRPDPPPPRRKHPVPLRPGFPPEMPRARTRATHGPMREGSLMDRLTKSIVKIAHA